uniref:Uncharacterized protein n=1 Tax=Virgibacillus oceani TaxID=1479511 RepID=A0A917LYM6_9BACI|nr:hypothetical protein GCM10011398_07620 [Virgibacillus oceani]
MIIDERIVCRSIIWVKLIIAGISFNKRYTVMHYGIAWRTTDRNGG